MSVRCQLMNLKFGTFSLGSSHPRSVHVCLGRATCNASDVFHLHHLRSYDRVLFVCTGTNIVHISLYGKHLQCYKSGHWHFHMLSTYRQCAFKQSHDLVSRVDRRQMEERCRGPVRKAPSAIATFSPLILGVPQHCYLLFV